MTNRPPTLIESWLPFAALGAESMRERGASSALPPLYFLHVWWARRPLTVSRAAIVASLLPDYETVAADPDLKRHFPSEERYHGWFTRLLGIHGDPVATRKLLSFARERNLHLGSDPYGYPRAFTANPSPEDLELMGALLKATWGTEQLTVLDPFAGGGSIPFEALRYGFDTIANELNPVAAVILQATLDYPARFGPGLAKEIARWGKRWAGRVQEELAEYYPKRTPQENIFAYLWARTVACPATGKPVPLSPNWWLSKGSTPVAARLLVDPAWSAPRFEIAAGDAMDFDPDDGTVSRGSGRSPWTGETIEGDYIKAEAQAGRMGQMLYAVAVKRRGGFDFRAPTPADLEAVARAEAETARRRPLWEAQDLIPTEVVPEGLKTSEPLRYGMDTWADLFAPRQLLALATFVETLRDLRAELRQELDAERAAAVETYLGLMLDKAAIYNNRSCRFDPGRGIRSIFDRHDFAFVWSHSEFDASMNLLPWAVDQVEDAYTEIANLCASGPERLDGTRQATGTITIINGSAAKMDSIPTSTIHAIITDPPYYDNVMYAELADFFYVWLKRTAGHLYLDWFSAPLTDKEAEAVANPARFADFGRRRKELAAQDYEQKMAAAFREMHRVLRDDGVLTVMFAHKQVAAWDTLAAALIQAGFTIESSWPVPTESEHSLHQAKKNAAQSTILLTCRKRAAAPAGQAVWWEDVAPRVRQEARARAEQYAAQGIRGVDLYISTFGPALSVISQQWPVLTSAIDERTGQPKPLRPDLALDLAREEVVRLRRQGLLQGRDLQFDPVTDWYLMAWDAFKAEQFPADEARKLALALGLDLDRDLIARRIITAKGSDVALLQPHQRRGRGRADPESASHESLLDAVHTVLLIYAEDGGAACGQYLARSGLRNDAGFKAAFEAMLNAVPRTRKKGKFVCPEAELLERVRAAFFDAIPAPPDEDEIETLVQGRLEM